MTIGAIVHACYDIVSPANPWDRMGNGNASALVEQSHASEVSRSKVAQRYYIYSN